MQKHNKTIISIVGICIIVGLLGKFLFDTTRFYNITQAVAAIGLVCGLILLIEQGTLIKHKLFFRLVLFSFGLIVVGIIMKFMHLSFANIILLMGMVFIPIIYSIHFFKKQSKHHLDIFKLVWVVILSTSAILLILHLPFGSELKTIEEFLFLIMLADFAYMQNRVGANK